MTDMSDTSSRTRQAAGQPTGGQFAAEAKSTRTGVDLDAAAAPSPSKQFERISDVENDLAVSLDGAEEGYDLRGLAHSVATYDRSRRAWTYRPEFDENSPEFDVEAFAREVDRVGDATANLSVPPLRALEDEDDPSSGHHYNPAARYARAGSRVEPDRSKVKVERIEGTMSARVVIGNTPVTMSVNRAADWADRGQREMGKFWARRAEGSGELRSLNGKYVPVAEGDWVVCDHFSECFTLPDEDYRAVFG